ncbi:hypothetical protein PQX77_005291 [Marasmius sp. AFHP31]|nr:hypothetical protein PQX77_005291 [Marasmius sp. AFHP31]
MAGHAISMGVFGYAGYWAYRWDIKSAELIAQKQAEIAEQQKLRVAKAEAIAEKLMKESIRISTPVPSGVQVMHAVTK